jgi:glycosyltransferase involved in cell wall biosynthesis
MMVSERRYRAVVYSSATSMGGAERYLSLIVPTFARIWDVTLFCPVASALDQWVAELQRQGVRVVRFDLGRWRARLQTSRRLIQSIRATDILFLNLVTPKVSSLIGVLGLLNRVPLRVGVQHLVLIPGQLSHYRIKQIFFRSVVARMHRNTLHWVISPSAHSAQILTERFGFPSTRVHVIHYGIDLATSRLNREPRPRLRKQAGDGKWPILGCVGWVGERKGQHLIVQALASLRRRFPNIQALFVGDGNLARLRTLARDLGVEPHVTCVGHRNDVDDFYRRMDVFVLPTSAEGLPFAAIEAMAHRLPIIASDIPPMRELLGNTGIFLRSRSPEAIAEAVLGCFDSMNPQSQGACARARAEKEFRQQRMIDETLALIHAGLSANLR